MELRVCTLSKIGLTSLSHYPINFRFSINDRILQSYISSTKFVEKFPERNSSNVRRLLQGRFLFDVLVYGDVHLGVSQTLVHKFPQKS